MQYYDNFDMAAFHRWVSELPSLKEFFNSLSNREIVNAAKQLGIILNRKRRSKRHLANFRKVINLFKTISQTDYPQLQKTYPYGFISFGLGLYSKYDYRAISRDGRKYSLWVEYFWDPLPVLVHEKVNLEDYPHAQLAAAIIDYYMMYHSKDLCEYL